MKSGTMEVLLVNAHGLKNNKFFARNFWSCMCGTIDSYVSIHYQNQALKSKVARGQGSDPEWNQKLTFKVDYPGKDNDKYKLTLKVMDRDRFSADDYLGEATIYLEDIFALAVEKGTAELHPQKYRIVAADKSYRGEIKVGVIFTPIMEKEEAAMKRLGQLLKESNEE